MTETLHNELPSLPLLRHAGKQVVIAFLPFKNINLDMKLNI